MPSTPGLFGLAALHATTDTMQPGETAIVDGVLYNRDGTADPVPVGGSGSGGGEGLAQVLPVQIEYDGASFFVSIGSLSASGTNSEVANITGALPEGTAFAGAASRGATAVGGSTGEMVPFIASISPAAGGTVTVQMMSPGADIGTAEVLLALVPA